MTIYTMLLRPVARWTLPDGVEYELTAVPRYLAGYARPDLPRSIHPFGEFTTSRPLTAEELDHFDIKVLA